MFKQDTRTLNTVFIVGPKRIWFQPSENWRVAKQSRGYQAIQVTSGLIIQKILSKDIWSSSCRFICLEIPWCQLNPHAPLQLPVAVAWLVKAPVWMLPLCWLQSCGSGAMLLCPSAEQRSETRDSAPVPSGLFEPQEGSTLPVCAVTAIYGGSGGSEDQIRLFQSISGWLMSLNKTLGDGQAPWGLIML